VRRLIVNARIATGDARRPWADAMLIEDGRVLRVGSSAALRKEAPEAEVIDVAGADVPLDGAPFLQA
jgi:predicted amidohydrolase YtcJ